MTQLTITQPLRHIKLNGETHATQAQTLAELIIELGFTERRIAVEHNGRLVPKRLHSAQTIAEDDCIEIVHAVGGG